MITTLRLNIVKQLSHQVDRFYTPQTYPRGVEDVTETFPLHKSLSVWHTPELSRRASGWCWNVCPYPNQGLGVILNRESNWAKAHYTGV
jgi:hypothetical protein